MPGTASLFPKEHGADAQLVFPLVTGMALAVPTLSTLSLGAAGVAFFLANESAAILLGAVFFTLGQGGYPALAGPAAALLFPALATFVLSLIRVHPKQLKRVGWSLVAANSVALVLLLQG